VQVIKLKNEPSYKAIHDAFDYQRRASDAIKDLEYAAIFHEQGLGKSKIAIDLALSWISTEELDTILIVTKKSLVSNWVEELSIHSHVKPKVLTGQTSHDGIILLSPARILICHYELVKNFESSLKMFCETRSVGVFLDESQKIKNPTSSLANSFFRISSFFKKRVIITGTPIANRPYDIWSQIFFLDSGTSLGTNFKEFKREYDLNNEMSEDREAQDSYIQSLQNVFPRISNFIVRETKNGCSIDLPAKKFFYIKSTWEPRQWDLYNDIKDDFKTYVIKGQEVIEESADGILKRILRLQQICSIPTLIDDSYALRAGKLDSLDDLIDEIESRGEKFIVWTQFTGTADYLCKYLQGKKAKKVTGKLSIDQRNKNIAAFKHDSEVLCLVATYGAAKEGLTLTVANNAIFFDRSLSLDDYVQSQDRIHRISQTKNCNIYILEMENSIERWVDNLINAKLCSADLALRDIDIEIYDQLMSFDFGIELKKALGVQND
jgi:SNF2 family DNA or RNA helicase